MAQSLIAQAMEEIRKRKPPEASGCVVQVIIDTCSDIVVDGYEAGSESYTGSCSWTDCSGSTRASTPSPEEVDPAVDAAVIKIQAGYRGFRTRKLLKSRRKTPSYDNQQVHSFIIQFNCNSIQFNSIPEFRKEVTVPQLPPGGRNRSTRTKRPRKSRPKFADFSSAGNIRNAGTIPANQFPPVVGLPAVLKSRWGAFRISGESATCAEIPAAGIPIRSTTIRILTDAEIRRNRTQRLLKSRRPFAGIASGSGSGIAKFPIKK